MRLLLCCLTINSKSPDIIILDEPTNNLDIQNVEILTTAINEYQGTLIVVSHDETFLEQVNIERTIELWKNTACNIGFAKAGLKYKIQHFYFYWNFVYWLNISASIAPPSQSREPLCVINWEVGGNFTAYFNQIIKKNLFKKYLWIH